MQSKQALLLMIISGIGILGILSATYGYEQTWQLWNIPVMSPHFADLRSITGGAESAGLGFDPMYENPGDPWDRPMNYPRIWQALFALRLNQSHTTLLGLSFIALFTVGTLIFIDKINRFTTVCLTLGIFSPALLLGVERANNDLLVFFLLALVLAISDKHPWFAMILANITVILKLFPLFGLAYLLGEDKRRSHILLAISFGIAVFYFVFTYTDLIQISQATQKGTAISYGTNVIGRYLANFLQRPSIEPALFWLLTGGSIFLLGPLLTFYVAKVKANINPELLHHTPYLNAFKLGAGIYIGTFLLGNNFDYRLIFLLFVVPQLVTWSTHNVSQIKWPACITLGAILLSWWSSLLLQPLLTLPLGDDIAFFLDESANWLVFTGLLSLLSFSLPDWLWRDMKQFKSRIAPAKTI